MPHVVTLNNSRAAVEAIARGRHSVASRRLLRQKSRNFLSRARQSAHCKLVRASSSLLLQACSEYFTVKFAASSRKNFATSLQAPFRCKSLLATYEKNKIGQRSCRCAGPKHILRQLRRLYGGGLLLNLLLLKSSLQ